MDPTVVVALVSAAGIVISASFGVLIAVITNRKETTGSAEIAAEKASEEKEEVLRERIQLKDEQLAHYKLMIVDLEADNERLRRKLAKRDEDEG